MTTFGSADLDCLSARLHARRSGMAAGARLDALCQFRTLRELGRTLWPESDFETAIPFQRRVVQDWVGEFSFCRERLDGAGERFVRWMQARFQLENLKVLFRGVLNPAPYADLEAHLVGLPGEWALDAGSLLAAKSADDFIKRLPADGLKTRLKKMLGAQGERQGAFFFEAALDAGYFSEGFARLEPLPAADKEWIAPLVEQEVEQFHFQLALLGKFQHGLAAESLLSLGLSGGAAAERFKFLLAAPDLPSAAQDGLGHVFDTLPAAGWDAGVLEALGWNRFLRLANRAFRRSHMGLAAVVGYLDIKRVEAANLITLSEGVRLGLDRGKIRARLIPRPDGEAACV